MNEGEKTKDVGGGCPELAQNPASNSVLMRLGLRDGGWHPTEFTVFDEASVL